MSIKEVLAKVIKGETLTDEEKKFLTDYDETKASNDAAKAARKKAEAEAEALKAKLDEAESKLEEMANDKTKDSSNVTKLQKQLDTLQKKFDDAQGQLTAKTREETIATLASKAGIKATKGVSDKAFKMLVEASLKDVDLTDESAVKTAFDSFKADNAGIIDASGIGTPSPKGNPSGAGTNVDNPWLNNSTHKPNITNQFLLKIHNPELAKKFESEAEAANNPKA